MSVVLMDNTSMKGKRLFFSRKNNIVTNLTEAEKFENTKKGENFLKSLPKSLKKYKFKVVDFESLNTNLNKKDSDLIKNVLGNKKLKIPKVNKKTEHFTENTRTMADVYSGEEISKSIEEKITKTKLVFSAPSELALSEAQKYIDELNNHLNEVNIFLQNITSDLNIKKDELSECDKRISTLHHLLELYGEHMNACEYYKITKEINEIIQKRRILKNSIFIGTKIKSMININEIIEPIVKEYEVLKEPTYKAEYYQDWFETKSQRKRIV